MPDSLAINKPTVFLSHAATDEPIVRVIRDEIMRIFAKGVDVFASSVPGTVAPGADWLDNINGQLRKATAVIVLITPVSLNRPWIWFEVGASWAKMEEGQGRIIPVCVPEIDKGALPEPLSRLQAMSLGKATETKEVFQSLIDLFGFGDLKGFRHAAITAKLPRYADLRIAESDLRSGAVYNGPYEAYSDEELEEVLDEMMLKKAWNDRYTEYGSHVFLGELIHFRMVDETYNLPPGTAVRLLFKAADKRYYVEASQHTANTIRIRVANERLEHAQLQEEHEQS
ncbi:MAG TPA: toll/interleukin-1 receptor domain-containing protein [Solirubrobacteraceae bacterium]|nr:toll/interleukin-1 receptor domain-containing protein [Solirubrobacteraceae bacterium]